MTTTSQAVQWRYVRDVLQRGWHRDNAW